LEIEENIQIDVSPTELMMYTFSDTIDFADGVVYLGDSLSANVNGLGSVSNLDIGRFHGGR